MTKSIPLTQGKMALVDDSDFEFLNQWDWYAHKNGNIFYARHSVPDNVKILMHRLLLDAPDDAQVDHINMNGLDNRRDNLRICTRSENLQNRKMFSNNKIGYKGVSLLHNKYYRATIVVYKKQIHIGYFETPEIAARAYDEKAKEYFGEFANLNFPDK